MKIRHLAVAALVVALVAALARSAPAQQATLAAADVNRIVTRVLGALVPPRQRLSNLTVAERGIRFDHERTLAAFGHPELHRVVIADARFDTILTPGTAALLEGCSQEGAGPCSRLGSSAYVWVEPLSIADSQAVVRVHVLFASRPMNGAGTPERAFLSGFAAEVYLVREPDGYWRYVRTGRTMVG